MEARSQVIIWEKKTIKKSGDQDKNIDKDKLNTTKTKITKHSKDKETCLEDPGTSGGSQAIKKRRTEERAKKKTNQRKKNDNKYTTHQQDQARSGWRRR